MELTREELKQMLNHKESYGVYFDIIQPLAENLLAEMDKPKVWDNAPDDAISAVIDFRGSHGRINLVEYSRTLPKSRARQVAEEIADKHDIHCDSFAKNEMADACEQAILKYAEGTKCL